MSVDGDLAARIRASPVRRDIFADGLFFADIVIGAAWLAWCGTVRTGQASPPNLLKLARPGIPAAV
jgi:hypothetical protein